jgi:DNA-binding IscR family transcriptional regulator
MMLVNVERGRAEGIALAKELEEINSIEEVDAAILPALSDGETGLNSRH